jgi:hypothetical protein
MNRAWKYKFSGELKILNFGAGHPAGEKSYVVCIIVLVENRAERKRHRLAARVSLDYYSIQQSLRSSPRAVSRREETRY